MEKLSKTHSTGLLAEIPIFMAFEAVKIGFNCYKPFNIEIKSWNWRAWML